MLEVAARAQADGIFLAQRWTGGDAPQGGGHGELRERRIGVSEGFLGGIALPCWSKRVRRRTFNESALDAAIRIAVTNDAKKK